MEGANVPGEAPGGTLEGAGVPGDTPGVAGGPVKCSGVSGSESDVFSNSPNNPGSCAVGPGAGPYVPGRRSGALASSGPSVGFNLHFGASD